MNPRKKPDVCVDVYRMLLALHMRWNFTRVRALDGSHNQQKGQKRTAQQQQRMQPRNVLFSQESDENDELLAAMALQRIAGPIAKRSGS